MRLHKLYHGKIQTALRCPISNLNELAIWYTPGVAAPCKAIAANPQMVYDYTHKWNTVAIVSDGSRVLGLGNIGAKAGLPVMEGKAMLYKYLGGVDAWPIMLDSKDPDKIVETVLNIQPGFGGINLEDIAQPKCFRILELLRQRAEIPTWHDDQQGTATVVLAGLINAVKIVGKKLSEVRIVFVGCGAANVACTRLLFAFGVTPQLCIVVDSKGILNKNRTDIKERRDEFVDKWKLCQITNIEQRCGGIASAMQNADVAIAFSKPEPDTIQFEWVKTMAPDAIVFACANPTPEIWPWSAKQAGAAIVATGRSDFPNQVNNSLVFPGIFRGTLDVRAQTITDEMCWVAANVLADLAAQRGINPEYILPTMDQWEVFPQMAAAVAVKAVSQGLAQIPLTYEQEYQQALEIIHNSREMTKLLVEAGLVPKEPNVEESKKNF
ncbi:MAG: NADP-dependent malic enzyme [Prochloraceae cyanobacterium]|nr:NADP-dependent malic enzyme [Prochloraceae cyanobacterium]